MTVAARKKRAASSKKKSDVTPTPTLAELQAMFQRAVMESDDTVLSLILDNSRTTRDVLLGVYQHAYVARLVEVLASDYEYLKAHMGEDAFSDMAERYVVRYPSRSPNARWFGQHLAEFLEGELPYRDQPELADLARVEFALSEAFDAEDANVLGIADLAAFAPELWSRLVFRPHPSAQMIDCKTDVMALWLAMKDEQPLPEVHVVEGGVQSIMLWRSGTVPKLRIAGAEEAMMWREACQGLQFGALCEMVATFADPDNAALRAAQYLQSWLVDGMLSGVALSDHQ
jgi:hypothetical protein